MDGQRALSPGCAESRTPGVRVTQALLANKCALPAGSIPSKPCSPTCNMPHVNCSAIPALRLSPSLTLALGIGAGTAIFSAVNPILFEPLPYPHARRLMMLWEMRGDGSPQPVTFATFHGLQERSRSFDAMAVMKPWQPSMAGSRSTGTIRGSACQRGLLPCVGHLARDGARLSRRPMTSSTVPTWRSSATGYGGCASPRTALLSAGRSNWMTTSSP